jgi:NAD(P)-dependent dehydrogenase (short-subunit alcohol dehydrogenase family)
MATPAGLTEDGYEIQFGTNHLGHALLTKLLLPTLKATATATATATGEPNADVRIITLSSSQYNKGPLTGYPFPEFKTDMSSTFTTNRYGHSKLANVHFTQQLALHHPELKCIAVHPGLVQTNLPSGLIRSWPYLTWVIKLAAVCVAVPVQTGVLNQLWAAFDKGVKSGGFYFPVGVEMHDARIDNETAARELWEWTEKECEGAVEGGK